MKKIYKCFLYIIYFSIMFSFPLMLQNNMSKNVNETCVSEINYSATKELSQKNLSYNSNLGKSWVESSLFWTTSTYYITLDGSVGGGIIAFGGEVGGGYVELAPSASATLSAIPNAGYMFKNWTILEGDEYINISNLNSATTQITAGTENLQEFYYIEISAVFEIDQNYEYSITYNLDGGEATNPAVYTPGTATFTLNNPTKNGYTFDGWSETGIVGKQISVTIEQGSTGNKTYTANWFENSYFLTYSPNGGTDNRENKNPVKIFFTGNVLTLDISAGIAYTGKTLSGWQIESSGVNLALSEIYDMSYVADKAGKTNNNGATITLNAVWTDNLYTIIYDLNGGNGTAPTQTNKKSNEYITTVSGQDIFKTGYNFVCWEIGACEIDSNTLYQVSQLASYAGVLNESTATITLKAKWNIMTYNIVYEFNDSQFPSATYNIDTLFKTLPNPTAITGHIFYWIVSETDEDSSWVLDNKYLPGHLNFESFYGNVTLRGEYIPNTFTIKYDINGGMGDLQAFEQVVTFSDEIFVIKSTEEVSAVATLSNYHIIGFSINDEMLDLSLSYKISELAQLAEVADVNNSDIVLKLEWRGDEYSINYYIYNEQISDYEIVELSPSTHIYGTATVLAELEKTGYTFGGWKLNGSEEILTELGATNFTADIELFGEYELNQYVIKFYDDLGEFLQQITMGYGEVYDEETFIPTKNPTQVYTFEFDAWYDGIGESANKIIDFTITQNMNFYAKFLSTLQKYTASFYSEDGTVLLQESELDYGSIAVYTGETLTKTPTSQYTYEHTGWSLSIGGAKIDTLNVTNDTHFYAYFEATLRKHLLQFFDSDGTSILFSENIDFGTTVNLSDYTPSDKFTQRANYYFLGWFSDISYSGDKIEQIIVFSSQQFYAKFNEVINKYTFTFKFYYNLSSTEYLVNLSGGASGIIEEDYGTELIPANLVPTYPTELADEHYNYNFVGWYENKNLTGQQIQQFTITENKTFFAKFSITPKSYNLYLWDENGENIFFEVTNKTYGTEIVLAQENGGNIIYVEDYCPTKESVIEYDFIFAGWYEVKQQDRQGDEQQMLTVFMDDNINLYACFESKERVYLISFYDASGNVVSTETYEFGSTIPISEIVLITPTKEQTAQYTFTFAGWYDNADFDGEPITEIALTTEYFNQTGNLPTNIYPKFDENLRYYNVYFRNTDESLYQELSVGYGMQAVYTGATPTKSQNLTFYFVFEGWSKVKFSPALETDLTIYGETTYYAYFKSEYVEYTLLLYYDDLTVFKTVFGHYNEEINLTNSEYKPTKQDSNYYYKFVGWYDNAEFTGDQVTTLRLTEQNISLYGKFVVTGTAVQINGQTLLIIIISLAVLVTIILIVAITSAVKKSGLKKLSRKSIYEINSEHEQRLKERAELERRIKEITDRYKNDDKD